MSHRPTDQLPQLGWPGWNERFMRVDLGERVQAFNQIIFQQGYRSRLTPVSLCPCVVTPRDLGMGTPRGDCKTCAGRGRFYDDQGMQEVRVIATGLRRDVRAQRSEGTLELGTIQLTVPSIRSADDPSPVEVNFWDRFTFPDVAVPITEALQRQPGEETAGVDLRFHAERLLAAHAYDPVQKTAERLVVGRDLSLDPSTGTRLLLGSHPLLQGIQRAQVSVTYLGQPDYYVTDLPNQYRGRSAALNLPKEHWAKLPHAVIVTRGDLFKS